jgi:hypothetical protein
MTVVLRPTFVSAGLSGAPEPVLSEVEGSQF